IMEEKPINMFNNGNMSRDFTFIDDIVEGIISILHSAERIETYKIFNIGKGKPELLTDFIEAIEKNTGKAAIKKFLPMQPGDVPRTWADTRDLESLGYKCKINMEVGVKKFV